jgi:hypothetical protein
LEKGELKMAFGDLEFDSARDLLDLWLSHEAARPAVHDLIYRGWRVFTLPPRLPTVLLPLSRALGYKPPKVIPIALANDLGKRIISVRAKPVMTDQMVADLRAWFDEENSLRRALSDFYPRSGIKHPVRELAPGIYELLDTPLAEPGAPPAVRPNKPVRRERKSDALPKRQAKIKPSTAKPAKQLDMF